MTEKYTPEKVAELVAESRVEHCSDCDHFIGAMGAALTARTAERDRFADALVKTGEDADRYMAAHDRLHKAITEARKLNDRAQRDPDIREDMERILRAALDKEGDDDGRM